MKMPFISMTLVKVCDFRHVSILPQQPPVNSHCCSSLLSLILHDPIAFQDAREDDGCTWENKTTTDPSSQHSPSCCGISISCHRRKATRGSEFMRGKYESFSFLVEDSRSVQESCKMHECRGHNYLWPIPTSWKTSKSAFIFLLHVWAAETTAQAPRQQTNPPFIYLCWHQAYDPLPPKPSSPKM